jgi:hypothetical protein
VGEEFERALDAVEGWTSVCVVSRNDNAATRGSEHRSWHSPDCASFQLKDAALSGGDDQGSEVPGDQEGEEQVDAGEQALAAADPAKEA